MNASTSLPSPVIRLVLDLRITRAELAPGPSRWMVRSSGSFDSSAWLGIQNEWLTERGQVRPWDEAIWRRELTRRSWWGPDRLLLAHSFDDPTPVGCVAIEVDAGAGWTQLHWLAVRLRARRQGVATRLLTEASVRARAAGCQQIRAETLRDWTSAVDFYLDAGFQETDWTHVDSPLGRASIETGVAVATTKIDSQGADPR